MIDEEQFNQNGLIKALDQITLVFKFNEDLGFSEMYLNGINVEKDIRSMLVSSFVSKVSELPALRRVLVAQQQEMGERERFGYGMDEILVQLFFQMLN